MHFTNYKIACLKASVVLVPSYGAAYLTEQMVWVVPTLAATSFFAASIGISDVTTTRRVDEDGDTGEDGDEGGNDGPMGIDVGGNLGA